MRGDGSTRVKTPQVAYNPQQLSLTVAFDPVAGNCGVSPGSFAQQLA